MDTGLSAADRSALKLQARYCVAAIRIGRGVGDWRPPYLGDGGTSYGDSRQCRTRETTSGVRDKKSADVDSYVTCGFPRVCPSRHQVRRVSALFAYAEGNGQHVFGAHLVWDEGFGDGWTDDDLWGMTEQQARDVLFGTIQAEVARYRDGSRPGASPTRSPTP
jgi:hypothetical protein